MKRNTSKHIEEALEGIQKLAGDLPAGKARRLLNKCNNIRYELRKAESAGNYPETVVPPFAGDDVRNAMDKRIFDRELVLSVLESGKAITSAQAVEMGVLRLSARIWELRHVYGRKIETRLVKTKSGDRVAEYRLVA